MPQQLVNFTVWPSSCEALRREFLNDISRRLGWLAGLAGTGTKRRQAETRAAIIELRMLHAFWTEVEIIEAPSPGRKRRASHQAEETKS